MSTTLISPPAPAAVLTPRRRVVETSRGTAHPEQARMREMVVQSVLLRADRIADGR